MNRLIQALANILLARRDMDVHMCLEELTYICHQDGNSSSLSCYWSARIT